MGEPGPPIRGAKLKALLDNLRTNAAKSPVQTTHNRTQEVHMPAVIRDCTHVYVKRAKVTPLGHCWDGPFPISERTSDSCVKIRVGSFANGDPRFELQHWNNLKPAVMKDGQSEASRVPLGRKPLNPKAKDFKSAVLVTSPAPL